MRGGYDATVSEVLEFPDVDSLRGTTWQNLTDRASLSRNTVRQLVHEGLQPL